MGQKYALHLLETLLPNSRKDIFIGIKSIVIEFHDSAITRKRLNFRLYGRESGDGGPPWFMM